jgi:hypothetical protein
VSKAHDFARDEVFPSYFINALQELISSGRLDIRLSMKNATTIQVVPHTELGIAGVNIEGRYRWIAATVERVHPGGAKGTYTIWATAKDDEIDDNPKTNTDHTDRAFALAITSGAEPEADICVKLGELEWSGTKIEALRQTYGSVTGAMLENGALSTGGDLEWIRDPSGAWIPLLKAASVGANEILDGSIGNAEIADALKPSKGAAGGTEALRAIGATASTVVAGNDSRLTDERTPKNNSVTSAKVIDGTLAEADYADGSVTSRKFSPTAGLIKGTAGEENITGVEAKRIAPGLLFNVPTASRLICVVTANWREEGAAGSVKADIGAVTTEVGKFAVKTEARSGYFDTIAQAGAAGWRWATVGVVLSLEAAERELWMSFWPFSVGGGNAQKILGTNWRLQYLLMK